MTQVGGRGGRGETISITTNKPISRDEFKEPSHCTSSYFCPVTKSTLNQKKPENSS